MSYARIIQASFKKEPIEVLVYLSNTKDNGKEVVKIRAMYYEYHIIEKVIFQDRDSAYDFIKDFTLKMAKSFVERRIYADGILNSLT